MWVCGCVWVCRFAYREPLLAKAGTVLDAHRSASGRDGVNRGVNPARAEDTVPIDRHAGSVCVAQIQAGFTPDTPDACIARHPAGTLARIKKKKNAHFHLWTLISCGHCHRH